MSTASQPDRILVLAPRGRDAELIRNMLVQTDIVVETFANAASLAEAIDEDAGCAIATVEALGEGYDAPLAKVLKQQPPWSDFPIIVLAGLGQHQVVSPTLGNITVLERPLAPNTLLVTVRAALRARRRQYQARAAIEQRDQFLAMLGHELRNPLGAIVMAADLIGVDHDRANVAKRLVILSRQAHHLSRLVDDLLDVARVTTGKVRLQKEPLAIDELVESSITMISEQARARELEIVADLESGAIVEGDPVRLTQILNNLLGNAVKYSPNRTTIRVASRISEAGEYEVRVRDEGIGIEPSMLGRVFELFAQAEAGLDRSDGGMGIGLTLVDRLVRLHGGSVEATSQGRGHGSEFTVRLPVSRVELRAKPAAFPISDPGAPVRAVVVEDSADLRELTVSLLEALGCEVEAAGTGPDGLALIRRTLPELSVIDIGLPGITGFQIAREVRSSVEQPITLVAVTGYGRKADRDEAIAAGFDQHYAKPVQAKQLRELVDRIRAERAIS